MNPLKVMVAAAAVFFALAAAMEPAWAHKGPRSRSSAHFSFGFWGPHYWGPGYWGPSYWGPGYWGPAYVPPVVVVPQEPRVYIERDDLLSPPAAAPAAPAAAQWWYWCASARQYYPYVASCTEGWQRVAPQPVPGAQ
jgi:hypothetical protein